MERSDWNQLLEHMNQAAPEPLPERRSHRERIIPDHQIEVVDVGVVFLSNRFGFLHR